MRSVSQVLCRWLSLTWNTHRMLTCRSCEISTSQVRALLLEVTLRHVSAQWVGSVHLWTCRWHRRWPGPSTAPSLLPFTCSALSSLAQPANTCCVLGTALGAGAAGLGKTDLAFPRSPSSPTNKRGLGTRRAPRRRGRDAPGSENVCVVMIQASGVGSFLSLCWREQPPGRQVRTERGRWWLIRERSCPCCRGHGADCPEKSLISH